MKVDKSVWRERMQNLINRRKVAAIKPSVSAIGDYTSHLKQIEVGKSVLDVGAGAGSLMKCLPPHTVFYTGIDPFPGDKMIQEMTIEECTFKDGQFETVVMFAALDNVMDFKKALEQIKRVASKNVLFLTGVGIDPDQYHTIKVTEQDLILEMKPFKIGYMKYLAPKILLIEFKK